MSARRPRWRDRVFRRSVGAATTAPAAIVLGSTAAAAALATGLPVLVAVAAGAAAWLLPALRAVARPLSPAYRRRKQVLAEVAGRWKAFVVDAEGALSRFRRARDRLPRGPLRDRLDEFEAELEESVDSCADLARWGHEAAAARAELDPSALEDAGAGLDAPMAALARAAAADQRDLRGQLKAVESEAAGRLRVINGRLDEAVGRAVELAGRARSRRDDLDLGTGELAARVSALREAVAEVEGLGLPAGEPRRGTAPA